MSFPTVVLLFVFLLTGIHPAMAGDAPSFVLEEKYAKEGQRQLERGDVKKALEAYEKAASLHPTSPKIRLAKGLVHLRLRQFTQACLEIELALALGTGSTSRLDRDSLTSAYKGLGDGYLEQGNTLQAEKAYLALLRIAPAYPGGSNSLGITYHKMEKYERAIQCFEDEIKNNKYDAEIYQTYANLALSLWKAGKQGAAEKAILRAKIRGQGDPWVKQVENEIFSKRGVPK